MTDDTRWAGSILASLSERSGVSGFTHRLTDIVNLSPFKRIPQ